MILTKFIIKMKLNSLVHNGPKIKQRCQTVAYRGSSIINNLVNVKLQEKKFRKNFAELIFTIRQNPSEILPFRLLFKWNSLRFHLKPNKSEEFHLKFKLNFELILQPDFFWTSIKSDQLFLKLNWLRTLFKTNLIKFSRPIPHLKFPMENLAIFFWQVWIL